MSHGKHWMRAVAAGLRIFAVLGLLLAAWPFVATAGTDALYSLHIRADNTDDGATTFGAHFTVTTEDGAFLGECTLEGDENSPPWQYCWVDVPAGIKVVVWQDLASIPAGYAPVENPIVFDTAFPTTTPHKIDVAFQNVPQDADGHDDSLVDGLVAALKRILRELLEEPAGVVGDDGFTLTLEGVSVSGASDVAPDGTTVRARLVTQELPEVVSGFADPVGNGVEVTLGEGLQPASPLTITFAPDVVAAWDDVPDLTNDLLPVVFASRDDGPGVELADAQMMPDGSVVVTTDHLSWFQPSLASKSGFSGWLVEQVQIFMQVRSNPPDCVDQLVEAPGWEFSAVPNQLVWPCAAETAGGLEVRFTNNSPHVWLVESGQATPGIPITLSISGLVIASMLGLAIDQTTTTPLVPPDGAVTFQVDDQRGPIVFDAAINERMTVANAVVSGLSPVLPSKKIEALGRAQCLIDVALAAVTVDADLAEGNIGGFVGLIIRCMGDFAGGLGGTLISSVAAVPGAVTALADVFIRQFIGGDEFSITLTRTEEETWTASFSVYQCNLPPNSGPDTICNAEAGIVVDISLASGEYLGSCTLGEPQPLPLGGSISTCMVEGLPFNADFVATQDTSTIPAGYEPHEEALYLEVDGLIPGGGDQTTFTFFNVPTDPGSTGAVIEGFLMGCNPTDACLDATVTVSTEDGQYITNCRFPPINEVAPWVCYAHDIPRGIVVALTIDGIAPGFEAVENPLYWDTTIEPNQFGPQFMPMFTFVPAAGGTSSGSGGTGEATVLMTFRGCPEGFDANVGDFFAACTIALDAPDAAIVVWGGDGQGGMNITGLDRQYNGEYVFTAGPGTMNLELSGLAPVLRDAYQVIGFDGVNGDTFTVALVDGETREIFVFYYYQ